MTTIGPLTFTTPLNDDMELVMQITYRVQTRRQGAPIEVECIAGEPAKFDLAALNGYDLEVLSIGTPNVGEQVLTGTVVRYTAPPGFTGDVVVAYDSRQKIAEPKVVAA